MSWLLEQLRWCFSQNSPSFIPNTFPQGFFGVVSRAPLFLLEDEHVS